VVVKVGLIWSAAWAVGCLLMWGPKTLYSGGHRLAETTTGGFVVPAILLVAFGLWYVPRKLGI